MASCCRSEINYLLNLEEDKVAYKIIFYQAAWQIILAHSENNPDRVDCLELGCHCGT